MRYGFVKFMATGAALSLLGMGVSSAQAATNSATANAGSTVISAVTITKNTNLVFGTAVTGTTAGTVSVAATAAGTQNCTVVVCTGGGNSAASFSLAGAAGYTAVLTIPATTSLTGPGTAMTATLSNSLTANKLLLTGNSTTDSFYVGGTLAVGANQVAGAYTGTFTVTVAYQ